MQKDEASGTLEHQLHATGWAGADHERLIKIHRKPVNIPAQPHLLQLTLSCEHK